MAQSHPYKLARLVHHNFDLSKRWYVIFWAWDASKDKLVRKRLFEPLNRKKLRSLRGDLPLPCEYLRDVHLLVDNEVVVKWKGAI